MPTEKYIENKTDMIIKTETIYNLLSGQVTILNKLVQDILRRYQTEGDNEKHLKESFLTIIEATEKVVEAQQILTNGQKAKGLANFIKRTKANFKSRDMAESKTVTVQSGAHYG